MFSRKSAITILCSATAFGLISGCAVFDKKDSDEPSNWVVRQFEKDGAENAQLATVAYSQGNFKQAEEYFLASLKENPRNPQALLVGALTYEQTGRPNRARQYYEDLILINGNETSILGTSNNVPEKMSDIARKRLRLINVRQSELVVEDDHGAKIFNISKENGQQQTRSAIEAALIAREQNNALANQKPSTQEEIAAVQKLFNAQEQNVIARFLILKELAEKDLITKEEFLTRRMTNVGGLLPLTHQAPGTGIDRSVPSADLIIERINVLKDAVEARAITPREFSAERDLIIEALLPPNPRTRMQPKAPSKDILGAAQDIRKLEVLYDLNLITAKEKEKEQKAIENYLGLNKTSAPAVKEAPKAPEPKPAPAAKTAQVEEISVEKIEEVSVPEGQNLPQPLLPEVSSPFNK